jgi:hypothetical protein
MLTNILKQIADRDCIIFSQYFFDFTTEGERNCKIRMVTYDFNGNIQKEEQIEKLTDDFHFFIYGSYMVVWLGQIFDYVNGRNNEEDFNKIFSILKILFYENKKSYTLSEALSLFNYRTKEAVIKNHATVQFKINKLTKGVFVRVIDAPLLQDFECQLYLFTILNDCFCKQYINAKKLLSCCYKMLERRIIKEVPATKSCQAMAYELTRAMIMDLLVKQGETTHGTI